MSVPTSPSVTGPPCAVIGVYRRWGFVAKTKVCYRKAETGVNRPLQDVTGEHFVVRARSGPGVQ